MARTLRPALGDRLAAGIEAHTIRPISMQVTKQRTLPATKAVISHRYRQRHVHTNHAHFDLVTEQARRLTITGSTLRPRPVAFKGAIARALRERVWPLLASGAIKPVIHSTFAAADAAQAHVLMESGQHIGKIVLQVV